MGIEEKETGIQCGLGIWLVLLCSSLVIISPAWHVLLSLAEWELLKSVAVPYGRSWAAVVSELWVQSLLAIFGLIAGVLLWRKEPQGVVLAKQFFYAKVTLVFFWPYAFSKEFEEAGPRRALDIEFWAASISEGFTVLLASAIWLAYLSRSRRVKSIYGP